MTRLAVIRQHGARGAVCYSAITDGGHWQDEGGLVDLGDMSRALCRHFRLPRVYDVADSNQRAYVQSSTCMPDTIISPACDLDLEFWTVRQFFF